MTAGEMSGLDEDGNVALSSARRGQIIYNFVMEDPDTMDVLEGTDPMKAKEWNELEITFTWEAGEPTLGTGSVTVSYHPVTDDLTKMTRYASGPTNDVIEITDCTTTLLFPYVTTSPASIPDWPSRMPRMERATAPSGTAVPMLLMI